MKSVIVVDRDEHTRGLLVRYLEAHGWSVLPMADGRRVVRRWQRTAGIPPIVVLELGADDTDDFELLGALAAHALEAQVLVCAPEDVDWRRLGVARVLPSRARFPDILAAIEEMAHGYGVREAAE